MVRVVDEEGEDRSFEGKTSSKEHEDDWLELPRLGDLCRREKELAREADEATNDTSPPLGTG